MTHLTEKSGLDNLVQHESINGGGRQSKGLRQLFLFSCENHLGHYVDHELEIFVRGEPRFGKLESSPIDQDMRAAAVADEFRKYGLDMLERIQGHFMLLISDNRMGQVHIITDKLAIIPVYYTQCVDQGYLFSDSLNKLIQHPSVSVEINNQAIYNYTYFHMIPSPGTVYKGVFRAEAASCLSFLRGEIKTRRYWMPRFREDNLRNEQEIATGLYQRLRSTIAGYWQREDTGCFLSGGLDSSSVAGFIAQSRDSKTPAFSIGFPIDEYNELPYARIAADRYKLKHYEKVLTPADVLKVLPEVIRHMEQPFGNSSVIPVFCCALFAKEQGVNVLLAGDGGDELFAGNTRYQKQLIFELYHYLPDAVKRYLHSSSQNGLIAQVGLLKKLCSYIKQAEIGLPQRMEQYNFLNRMDVSSVFTSDFMKSVNPDYPEELCKTVYESLPQATAVSKMLYLDWKHTLTDNDLVKVRSMCDLAEVEVRFPMLDDVLIEYSCDIPSPYKVSLSKLRGIYKRAVKGFLPNKIINKKKHGFGLPFGLWIQEDEDLRAFAYEALEKLKMFNIYPESFIEFAKEQHQRDHASYYGELIWILMVLGEWLAAHESGGHIK